jgi:hypothetical protein
LPNHSKERDQAEAWFKKAQKATQDAKEARADYESEARTVREKTARLKALRLAKEAADLETRVNKKPIASKNDALDLSGGPSFFVRIMSARM